MTRKRWICQRGETYLWAKRPGANTEQKNSHHVLHRLLPAKSTQPYNLRRRRHSVSLTQKQSSYDDCNFITRMLFYEYLLTELFLSVTAYIIVPLCGVSYVFIKRIYVCICRGEASSYRDDSRPRLSNFFLIIVQIYQTIIHSFIINSACQNARMRTRYNRPK